MLTTDTVQGTTVITVTYDGSLGAGEVQAAREKMATAASAGTTGVRVLLDVRGIDLGRVEPKAVWEDLKGARLLDDVERAALLSDSTVLKALLAAGDKLTSMKTKTFEPAQRDEAIAWLQS